VALVAPVDPRDRMTRMPHDSKLADEFRNK